MTLWSLNVMGGSVAAVKPALHLVAPVPNRLRRVWLWGLQGELLLLLSHASSEADENRLPTVTNTQHNAFRDMNSGLRSFLRVSLIAGPQAVQAVSLLQVKRTSPQPQQLGDTGLASPWGLERHELLWGMGQRTQL